MKKIIRIVFSIIEVIVITLECLFFFAPTVTPILAPFNKVIVTLLVIFSTYWIIDLCIIFYHKEIGMSVEGKIRYKKDKERKVDIVEETDTLEVYSNFERAEFTSKIKDSYQKQVYAFPVNMPNAETSEEESRIPLTQSALEKKGKPDVKIISEEIETPIVTNKIQDAKEPEPVKEVKKGSLQGIKKCKTVNISLWEDNVVKVSEGWENFLTNELKMVYNVETFDKIQKAYESETKIYPAKEDIFKPFELTDFANVRVVILGKLPFYRKDQADGLAYSSADGTDINESTSVIINECINDVGIAQPSSGSLVQWAKEGVLLLNATLTSPSNKPAAHTDLWKNFTFDVLKELALDPQPKVFVLWGEFAKEYLPLLEGKENILVLEAVSPSPLSANSGFYGSKPFSKINDFLEKNNIKKINWQL